ncbi:ATP phosphoribosyltransferase [Candidatus Peregrinibacteria bacterium CG_4_10_14_0_2_um_filter_43_11]|nr:MAG: ATP phosphoribosyltransferase [Candidatus Peregrinibacteria bacterium CG_4_10_14_0_2_um_filter_43_11]
MRIAIQNKGRLSELSIAFLRSSGLSFQPNGRSLITRCDNEDVEILYLRSADIPEYVRRGVADFGIVGRNVLEEKEIDLPILRSLDFGQCRLVIAVPQKSSIQSIQDLEGERIATSYPNTLSCYLKKQGVSASIIPLRGSVEAAPALDLADAICDLVQTGKTLKDNGLTPLVTVLESEAVLITNLHRIKTEPLLRCMRVSGCGADCGFTPSSNYYFNL